MIADIDAESPAAKSGHREGDVIQEVNKPASEKRERSDFDQQEIKA